MKTGPILFFALIALNSPFSYSASRNLCDDLIDSNATPEQIKKCQEKLGKSEYAKTKEATDATKLAAEVKKKEELDTKSNNIEIKVFTKADLDEAGFGKPFFAIRGDYRNYKYKEKRITEGDALCKYLGFEKAIKSIVSSEIMPGDANKKGLIVDTSIFGKASSEPELYKDDQEMFTVRKYEEISCAKRKDKNLDTNNEALKLITEDLIVLNDAINGSKDRKDGPVDNTGRSKKDTGSSSYGYKKPEWADDAPAAGKGK